MRKIFRRVKYDFKKRFVEHFLECLVFIIVLTLMVLSLYIKESSDLMERNIIKKFDLYAEVNTNIDYDAKREIIEEKETEYYEFINELVKNNSYSYFDYNKSSEYLRPVHVLKIDNEDSEFYCPEYEDEYNVEEYFKDCEAVISDICNGFYNFDVYAPRSALNVLPKEFKFGLGELVEGRYFHQTEIAGNDMVCIIPDNLKRYTKDGSSEIEIGDYITISEILVDNGQLVSYLPYEFKVVGKYKSVDGLGFRTTKYTTEHPIYISHENFNKIYDQATVDYKNNNLRYLGDRSFFMPTNAVFKFDTGRDFRYFVEYFENLRVSKNVDYSLNTTANNIYYSIQNIMYVANIISYVSYAVIFVLIVFALLIMIYNLESRQKEIGLLISFGEKRINIIIQYVFEILTEVILMLVPSIIIGKNIGLRLLANTVSAKDIIDISDSKMQIGVGDEMISIDMLSNADILRIIIPVILLLILILSVVSYLYIRNANPKEILIDE